MRQWIIVIMFITFTIQNQNRMKRIIVKVKFRMARSRTKNILRVTLTMLLLLALFTQASNISACTIIAVGKKASADGSVMISHTDCGADCRIRVVPGQLYKKGNLANIYWGIQDVNLPLDDMGTVIGTMPQALRTYKYFHSAYPHMSENQLAIAESTTSQREEMKVDMAVCKQIMTVEQAQVFALQRCKTSREAVELIGSLMSQYGFLPSCVGESENPGDRSKRNLLRQCKL